MYSCCVKRVFYSTFVRKCTDMCKHRSGVQLLQNPPFCSSTAVKCLGWFLKITTTFISPKEAPLSMVQVCQVSYAAGHYSICARDVAVDPELNI
jgi:hypothetical protein